jgi:hypothetical protein
MASYYLSFKCDTCGKIAVAPILGMSTSKQEELFAADATHDAKCEDGHKSVYFTNQLIGVHRKLSEFERATEPELLGDDRFADI